MDNETTRALCPHCFGKDTECKKCSGTGYVQFSLPSTTYTVLCPSCDGVVGGGDPSYLSQNRRKAMEERQCPFCGHQGLKILD